MQKTAILLALAFSAVAAPRPVTLDDTMKLRTIVDVRIAPDGESVAYLVSTPNIAKNEHEAALFVVPTNGGSPVRLADGFRVFNTPLPRAGIRWSPDGASVAVLGFGETNRPQVFAIPLGGGAPIQLTQAAEGVFGFEWSPDGKSIAYLSRESLPADEAKQRALVNRVDAPDLAPRLYLKAMDGPAHVITPPSHYVDGLSWSPDGNEIAYSAASRSGFTALYFTKIYAVPVNGGPPRVIVDRAGMNTRPQYSPDGKRIALISTGDGGDIMSPRSLTIVSAAGGSPRLHGLGDTWVNEMAWAADSRSIYIQGNDGTFASKERMFEQPLVRVWVEDGRAERAVPGAIVAYAPSVSADGRRLTYRAVEGRTMGDVFVLDTASGRTTKVTEVNPELRDLDPGAIQVVSWPSFDKMEIYGLLLTPPGWTPDRRVPMLIYIHGGPGGGVTHGLFPQFMHVVSQIDPYPTAAMAGAGYAILFPMPRGGSGYGEAGQRMIVNAWGEADYRDIMTGVDAMVARGIADPDRLGVMGASYGGYMTEWVVTQTTRFKVASAAAGISDLTDPFYLTDGGDYMATYFKRPWENRASYAAHSPITFVENVRTPLLIQHGERDPRVPVASAWKFYRALKALSRTVELDIYPRGGHVYYEPQIQQDAMKRNLEWFGRWIHRSSGIADEMTRRSSNGTAEHAADSQRE